VWGKKEFTDYVDDDSFKTAVRYHKFMKSLEDDGWVFDVCGYEVLCPKCAKELVNTGECP